jgi:hypothetical protein
MRPDPPPKQRCGWFGDFISDDRAVVKHNVELAGGLPPGAKTADSVRARSAGSHNTVYRDRDTTSWQTDAMFLGLFSGALLLGITLTIILNRLSRRDGAAGGPPGQAGL